jgi:hypothetical protein
MQDAVWDTNYILKIKWDYRKFLIHFHSQEYLDTLKLQAMVTASKLHHRR